jgi:hypothetical protein
MFARVAILSSILFIAGTARPARASVDEDLQKQLTPAAKVMIQLMKNAKPQMKSVSFVDFQAPKGAQTAYALGVRQSLIVAVEREAQADGYSIKVVEADGDLQVFADMFYAKDVADHLGGKQIAAIKVHFRLRDSSGSEVNIPVEIKEAAIISKGVVIGDPAIVAAALGLSLVFPPGGSKDADQKELREQKDATDATFQLVNGDKQVRAKPGSPYGIEIMVIDEDNVPKTAQAWAGIKSKTFTSTKDGKNPFLDLQPGQAYAIKILNDTDYDAAVEITIDGLSVFQFVDPSLRKADGRPKYQYYIVPRKVNGGFGIIPGWHKDNSESMSFVVRDFGKGAVNRVPGPKKGAPGVITITIAGAWNENEDPPAEIRGKNAGKNETGTGAPVKTGFTEVKREIGKFNTIISIHYSH